MSTTLFDRVAPHTDDTHRYTAEAESALIVAAQSGDEDAHAALSETYSALIRTAVTSHARFMDREEAEAAALVALCEAIAAWSPDRGVDRLGPLLRAKLEEELWDARANTRPVPVHYRALKRYYGLVVEYGGDYHAAAAAAPTVEMAETTFWAVHAAVTQTADLSDVSAQIDPWVSVDNHHMAWAALSAVDGEELDVTRHAYGFETGGPMSDAEIVEAISERDLSADDYGRGDRTVGRRTVQRRRAAALVTMRRAVGVQH